VRVALTSLILLLGLACVRRTEPAPDAFLETCLDDLEAIGQRHAEPLHAAGLAASSARGGLEAGDILLDPQLAAFVDDLSAWVDPRWIGEAVDWQYHRPPHGLGDLLQFLVSGMTLQVEQGYRFDNHVLFQLGPEAGGRSPVRVRYNSMLDPAQDFDTQVVEFDLVKDSTGWKIAPRRG